LAKNEGGLVKIARKNKEKKDRRQHSAKIKSQGKRLIVRAMVLMLDGPEIAKAFDTTRKRAFRQECRRDACLTILCLLTATPRGTAERNLQTLDTAHSDPIRSQRKQETTEVEKFLNMVNNRSAAETLTILSTRQKWQRPGLNDQGQILCTNERQSRRMTHN
jgi:hypothetical protein